MTIATGVGHGKAPWGLPDWIPSDLMGATATALLVAVAFLVVYPILCMVSAVVADATGTAGLGLDATLLPVLRNTVVVVGGSSLIALAFGTCLALINERTDGGLKGLGSFMPVAPLMLPSITGVLGLVVLFDPRVGLVNVLLRTLFGMGTVGEGPLNIYSIQGIIFAMSIHLVPGIYLIVSAALRNLDPSLEEASRTFGAGPLRTAVNVTIPAVRPALFEAWLLSVINGIGMFAVPVILGTGAQVEVVSVRIWTFLTTYPTNQPAALVLAGGLLCVVLILRFTLGRLVSNARAAVIGGRGVRSAPTKLGALGHLTRALIIGYILISLVLPVIALFIVSLEQFWTAQIPWGRLSLDNYERVLTQNPATIRALINSLMLATAGATITIAVAGFLMLYAHLNRTGRRGRKRFKKNPSAGFKGAIDFITSLPTTIPHSLVGVSFILAFSYMYGSIWVLLLAFLMMELPYAAAAARSSVGMLGHELTEASRIFRATAGRTMYEVLLPLVLPGLAAGWILVFIKILGEVTASAILSGTSNPVVGSVLLDLWRQGNFPMMTAFALIIWLIASILVGVLLKLQDWSLSKAR